MLLCCSIVVNIVTIFLVKLTCVGISARAQSRGKADSPTSQIPTIKCHLKHAVKNN